MKIQVSKPEKLIKFIIHNFQGISFGNAQKLIRLGKVKVNDNRCKENISLNSGDNVEIFVSSTSKPTIDILYEDDKILIVFKPNGIECATRDKSSANTYSIEELLAEHSPIIVHRLDRLTEGILIIAKSKNVAQKFEEYFRLRKIDKFYKACVQGKFTKTGIQTAYLKKDSQNAEVTIFDTPNANAKEIITEFNILEHQSNYTLLDIKLHTGRTHQIRAHCAHLGHPIIHDNKYGNGDKHSEYKGYYLTAYKIKFNLDDDFQYLNELNIEITPTWLQYLK